VAGVDLTETLCAAVAPRRGRVFLLGAAPGVADAAAAQLRQRCPGLEVAGTAHGFFPPEDEPALLARIRQAAPDILLVAFGAPRQEDWMRQHAPSLSVPVLVGVGGTLDVLAGRTRRAPRWVQGAGLEWLYRMVREPWRWSVVKTIPPLFLVALRERFRGGRGGRARPGAPPGREPGGRQNENRSAHPAEGMSEKEVRAATE
jgi:N-acetylglucosaminyldiphosphoundecaprenol N-acetyl-beta-D-mannosaminyltransferase